MEKIFFNPGMNGPYGSYVKTKVNEYFQNTKILKTGNAALYWKSVILLSLFALSYGLLVIIQIPAPYSFIQAVLLGMDFAAIGFCVMHDANHGSYSENKELNKIVGLSLNLLGGINYFWIDKHNVQHHTYVNVDGHDEDIHFGELVRMSPLQKRHWWHRGQAYYLPILYGIFYFGWVWVLDPIKYVRWWREGRLDRAKHINFWVTKISYAMIWIVIPLLCHVPHWGWIYFILGFVCSLIISFVFQLAHVVEGASFFTPDAAGKLPEEFAVHQVKSTSNFSPKNKYITWFVGGLNFQIEHHLFPRISHIHYPAISRIVREASDAFHVPYQSAKTIWQAIGWHMRLVHRLGQA